MNNAKSFAVLRAIALAMCVIVISGCVASQSTDAETISTSGAASSNQTVIHPSGMTVQTNDGAPNLFETADGRVQSAVPGSIGFMATDDRTMGFHSIANANAGLIEWKQYGPLPVSFSDLVAAGIGADEALALIGAFPPPLTEHVTIEDFTAGDREKIIQADNEGVVTWAELQQQLSEDQLAAIEKAMDTGASLAEAIATVVAPSIPIDIGGGEVVEPVEGGDA